jgi:hypothetical protein
MLKEPNMADQSTQSRLKRLLAAAPEPNPLVGTNERPEQKKAKWESLVAFWSAKTDDEEREAWDYMLELGIVEQRPVDDTKSDTTISTAVWRAEFAGRLARSLLMFPLNPQPGDSWEQHEKGLEVAFTTEITKALNKAEANGK